MPTSDADILAGLDFTPGTQRCECRGKCGQHPPGRRCPESAQFYAKVHAFGFCKQPGLTVDGGAVHIVCATCQLHHARLAAHLIEASHRHYATGRGYLICATCGREVIHLHDWLEVKELTDV